MCRLIESIRWNDGQGEFLGHEQRMQRALLEIFNVKRTINLQEFFFSKNLPKIGLYKIRLIYDLKIRSIEILPYHLLPIKNLKIVHTDNCTYSHKFENRQIINDLFSKKEKCDDIIIINNGMVTDTSFANIIFKKNTQWYTPKTYLLNGTMRKQLIENNSILEADISMTNLNKFEKFKLINALMKFDSPSMDITKIIK